MMSSECDIKTITNEDLLKKMWHQTEDLNRRKEIHSHLYQLRESRLRDLYNDDSALIMADQRAFAKDPLTPCHGDSLVDQSFQSLKSKEVRDSMSPTHDMKFHSLSLNHPNSAGWDVQSSSEVRPDGRARRSETIAKTEGVENIDGGVAAYRGHNEQRSSASHEGDDQNYVKKASESSKTHLQENVVIGDSNSGRTEIKSSSKTSSSSQVISSSSTVYHDDAHDSSNNYLMDDQFTERQRQREQQHYRQQQQQEHLQSRKVDQSEISKHHHQQTTEQYNRNQQEMSTNTQLTAEQIREDNKHYVDMDKISPEYQERVRFLMAQPGEIISNTVEYPKPNVKMITTVKRLPDGTVVKNKRYETEELEPTSGSTGHQRLVSKELNQSNKQTTTQRRSQDQENIYTRLQNTRNTPTNRPRDDSTDDVGKIQGASPMQEPSNRFPGQSQAVDAVQEDVSNISTFSSSKIQKSSKRFSTETTSETIEEIEDRPSSNRPSIRPKSRESQDFTTHGFPSVRSPTRTTPVYPNGGPQKPREDTRKPSKDFTTHGFPSVRSNTPTQEYPTDRPQVARGQDYRNPRPSGAQPGNKSSPQYVPVDGEVVVVSETKNSSNYKTNTEHVVETEIITDRDYPRGGPRPGDADTRPDFSTHGFPSVKMESPQKTSSSPVEKIHRPSQSNTKPDFSTHGFPSVRESGNTKPDFSTHGFPSVRETSPQRGESPRPSHYTSSPRQYQPRGDFSTNGFPSVKTPLKEAAPRTAAHPSSPRQSQPREDFSTNGFPSVKMPTKESPVKGYQNAKEIPIVMETQAPSSAQRKSQVPTSSVTSVKKQNTSTATKVTTVRKEKEVDAAHRAFAASLRSSSPADSIRRDSNTDQQPRHSSPRSSLASSRASHRREVREGSHDSLAASETSRFSSNTVTRQSPSKVIPKTSLPKHTVTKPGRDTPQRFTTKSHSPSPSPSPSPSSPSKTITSSTRVKKVAADVPAPANKVKKPAASKIPINESLTKNTQNLAKDASSFHGNEVVEEPCTKKYYYLLGPSEKPTSPTSVEKSPISPTSSSSKPSRTSPKKQYPAAVRDDFSEGNSEIIDEITYPSDSETSVSEYFHQQDKQNITQDFLDTKTITRDTNFEKTDDDDGDHDRQPSRKGPKSFVNESPSILRSGIPKVVQREDDLTLSLTKTRTNQQTKNIKTVADDFITNESVKQQPCYRDDELPDGAFISKPNEPEMEKPSSPTYKKKGLSRHETFEERCRQILGMEEFGDTQGTYTTRRDVEPVVSRQPKQDKPAQLIRPKDQSLVRIEDCEDDETNYTSEPSYRKPGKQIPSKALPEETPQYTQRDTKSTNVSGSKVSESSTTFIDNEKNVKVTRPRTSPERPLASPESAKKPIDKTPNKPSPGPHEKTTSRRTSNTVDVRETKRDVIEYDSEISLTEEEEQDYNDRTSTTQITFESSVPNQNKKRSPERKPSPVRNDKYPTNEKPSSCKIPTNKKKSKEEVVVTITTTEKPKVPKDTEDFPNSTLKVYENDSDESGPDNQETSIRINRERDYNKTTKIDYSTSKALHTSDHFDETRTSSPERRYSPEPKRPSADTRRQPETSQRKPSPVHSPERKHSPKRITKDNVSNEQSRRVETTSKLTKKYVSEERKTHSPERKQPYEICSSPEPKRTPQGKESPQRQNIPQRKISPERYDSPESKDSPERTHSPQRQHLPRRELIPKRVQTAEPKSLPEKNLPERKTSAPIKKQPQYNKQSPKRSPQRDHVTEYTVGSKHVSQHTYSEEREYSTDRKCSPKRVQKYSPDRQHSPEVPDRHDRQYSSPERQYSPEPRNHSPEDQRSFAFRHSPERPYSPKYGHVSPEREYSPHSSDRQHSPERKRFPNSKYSPERPHSPDHNSQSHQHLYTSEITRSPVTKPSGPMKRSSSPTVPSKSKPQKPAAQQKNVLKPYERDTKETSRSVVVSKNILKTTSKSTKDESSSMKRSTSFEKVTTTNSERQKPTSKSRKPSKETLPTYKTVTTKIIKSTEPSTENVRTKPKRTGSPSPSTSTERRRSSNISVHTEIVIDHSGPKSPKTKDATRTISKTDEDLINSLQFQKTSKKVSVTERKESAPVHRVTHKDKDAKMLRTTSEKIIKNTATSNVKKTPGNVAQPTIAAPKQDRRPNKCLTTKSINLSTLTNNIVSSKDDDGIVIDIQHAKSSREPSPDKIVPTPVGSEVDTGKPRYPDVVQEPEDEPRRKPVVKNIAIFEEEANDFVGCQIVEVNVNKTTEKHTETERNDEILDSRTIEAPASLEYQSPERMTDDVCLLSVHDKVSKFTLSAEEEKKPKPSGKFNREIDRSQHVPEDDECLLTVDEKVHKFLKTAEKITNETFTSSKEIDCSNYRPRNHDESYPGPESKPGTVNKSKTLAATSPQKSPELVANIEKQMSRQTEFMEPSEATKPTPKPIHRQERAQRNRNETHEIDDEDEESEELVPMTKTHTTSIELKRQKDILSRTSIFDDDKRKPTNQKQHPNEGTQKPVSSKTGKTTSRSIDSSPQRKSYDDVPENKPKYTERDRKSIFTTKVSNVKQKFEPQSQTVIPTVQSTRKEKQEYKETDYEDETSETEIYQTTTTNINRKVPEGNRRIPDNRPGSPMKRPSISSKPSHKLPSSSSPQYSSVTRTSVSKSNEYAVDYIPNEPLSDSEEIEQFEEDVEYNITAAGPRSDKPVPSPSRKAPSIAEEHPKQPQLVSHSPTPSHNKKVASNKVTDRTVESIQSNSRNSRRVEIEQLSGSPVQKKPQTQGRLNLSPESVAARRNLFEKGTTNAKPSKPSAGPATRSGNTTLQQGRRPSYMDHTKSSLEHIRRDSLEINKSHYSRRTSMEEEEIRYEEKPNSAVKFVIPEQQKHSKEIKTDTEEINIEEIFDLIILEQMLETVASYELRRRIRAQIRLVKKNMQNLITSTDSEVRTTEERQKVSTKETKSTGRVVNKTTTTNLDNRSISPKNIRRGVATSTPTTRTTVETDEEPEMVHWQKTEITSQYSDGQVDSTCEETSGKDERTTERVPKNARTSERTATRVHVERSTKSDYNTSTQKPRSDPSIKESPKSPIWADRKNVLKNPNSKSPMKTTTTSSASVRSSNSTKTTSATSRNQRRHQVEEDSIISSYGIGPTDENGLPLFGIKALKKKPQQVQPSETTEEVTGYVVEEKYYADNTTTQPIVKRKELIYSTNADKLEEIQRKLNTEAALTDDVNRQQVDGKKYASGEISMLSHDPTEEFLLSSKKYVRRGSVKEMSEKFIRKESSQSITEKSSSSNYPKAGLILRTNSRSGATDEDTSELRQNKSKRKTKYELRSSDEDDGVNYDVRESRHSARMAKESESETESVNMRKEVRRSEKSTRSFLNSSKESRVVSGVDDVLERMRNADNVQEDGDTADDQEARALLNKFLGASVIMSGVETILPTKQTKIDASNEHSSNFDKQQVKTTRVTKTIKSGNSSSPVARKTCDIEEIWDEELLKQLLEQASSYEERRVIRARLRQLMAEREENKTASGHLDAKAEADAESSASEYEEIIEEVTDYSDADENVGEEVAAKKIIPSNPTESIDKSTASLNLNASVEAKVATVDREKSTAEPQTQQGESLIPFLQDLLHQNKTPAEKPATQNSEVATSSFKNLLTRTSKSVESSDKSSLSVSANNKHSKGNTNNTTTTTTANNHNHSSDVRRPTAMTTLTTNNSDSVGDQLTIPPREDSGTESGEDLRLIAAGIRDKLYLQSDSNLIEEVTTALNRLESSLKEGKDISLDERKRKALLALVARLQTGLTSPEKLADGPFSSSTAGTDAGENHDETSSPEADAHRTNRQRFAKRRNRNNRHTVGVSREELEDARRYMEDMLLMENISTCTTPESSVAQPSWFPVEKNASGGAVPAASNLSRPNQFLSNALKNTTGCQADVTPAKTSMAEKNAQPVGNKRPLSGDYSVSFAKLKLPQNDTHPENNVYQYQPRDPMPSIAAKRDFYNKSPDLISKTNRFNSKKLLMKRANTIDIPKGKNYNAEFETDSEADDKTGSSSGLRRAVQVSVKQKVRSVVPPFEPKTENDHKFLAFINKQSPKPGLGWNNHSRSVSNWTNKFGSIKHTFEVGAAAAVTSGKPPQVPGHSYTNAAKQHWHKQVQQQQQQQAYDEAVAENLRLQKSQQQAAAERRRRSDWERSKEIERLERDRRERERVEREHLELKHLEQLRLEKEKHQERIAREREHIQCAYQKREPAPVNKFIHAPQSVFRPIENSESQHQNAHSFKPITQNSSKTNPDFPLHSIYKGSATSAATSPIGMPWLSKTDRNPSFKLRANKFEEKSQYQLDAGSVQNIQRHNSLRSTNVPNQQQLEQYRKRPSLPNTSEPYFNCGDYQQPHQTYHITQPPPPPTNISFTYADKAPKLGMHYQSYPCLPTAVTNAHPSRSRDDSLTNPQAEPLVLTTANPLYSPQRDVPQTSAPNSYQRQFDYASPMDSPPTSPSFFSRPPTDCTDDDLDSDSNGMEYRVKSKVMGRPQAQKAVTVGRKTNHVSDDEVYGKNSRAARNLLHTMKNISNGSNGADRRKSSNNRSTSPKPVCLSPDGSSYQAPVVSPLFPQLTNYEPNRSPMYAGQKATSMQSLPTNYQQNPTYEPLSYVGYPSESRHRKNSAQLKGIQSEMPSNSSKTGRAEDNNSGINYKEAGSRMTQSDPSTPQKLSAQEQFMQRQTTLDNSKPEVGPKPQIAPSDTSIQKKLANSPGESLNQTVHRKVEQQQTDQLEKQRQEQQRHQQYIRQQQQYQQQLQDIQQQQQYQQQISQRQKEIQKQQQQLLQSKPQTDDRTSSQDNYGMSDSKQHNLKVQKLSSSHKQTKKVTEEGRRISSETTISDIQQLSNKAKHLDYIQTQSQQYKSSAPMDTPDIVKSSLPKDEFSPILKKFGPPQRHNYMPNSYQTPNPSSNSKQFEMTTRIQQTAARNVVQSSILTNKPTVVEERPSRSQAPSKTQSQQQQPPTEDFIPRNIVFNNVSAFTSMSRRCEPVYPGETAQSRSNKLNKCGSWTHVVQQQSHRPTATAANCSSNHSISSSNELRRSKSGHTLVVPKMFEAGIDKSVVSEKQKTVAAYFSSSTNKSLNAPKHEGESGAETSQVTPRKSAINRTKTTAKVATSRMSLNAITSNLYGGIVAGGGALTRSATMPHIANLNLLDESNVEDAFEQLLMEHFTTTEKSETKEDDGAVVTTTTKVTTTRTVSQAPKPVSPFAKFKQLDKQNSQQSPKSPSTTTTTPTTPGGSASGSAAIFKFTDPALNARAATVKEQLLQWCQIKTKEYENIQINNFSTSWSDGLAFCALIHHFLPDAFDYSKLTPQNRRHNFELAFTVADEKAGIAPLLDVEDMVEMKRPDWKCVFVYVQSIYRRFRNCQ